MVKDCEGKTLLVQFQHNGSEHKCGFGDHIKKWNTGEHARKFIRVKGKYLSDLTSHEKNDELMFWGEWEAESIFEKIKCNEKQEAGYPKYIHKPVVKITNELGLQNTDPYVFGDNFIFSCCKQQSFKQLRHLQPGSIIVFGSKLDNKFVIDTVFVIKDGQDYNINNIKSLDVSRTFYEATLKRIFIDDMIKLGIIDSENAVEDKVDSGKSCINKFETCLNDNKLQFRLYKGVSYEEKDKFKGMFSFFPCKQFKEDEGFKRVHLESTEGRNLFNDDKSVGVSYSIKFDTLDEAYKIWKQIADSILKQGYCLGIYAEEPVLE